MADNDHLRQPRRRRRWHDSRRTRGGDHGAHGGSWSDTTIATPHGSDGYTSWLLYLDPWTDTIQMWPGSREVDVQQSLPSAMLAGALRYGLPLQ
jgi:hypothetical protein